MIWWQAVLLFNGGALLAGLCIIAGAFIMFRATTPSSNAGFFREPKGEVFSIPDETGMEFPGTEEPGQDEKKVLERTNRFLKSLGDKS